MSKQLTTIHLLIQTSKLVANPAGGGHPVRKLVPACGATGKYMGTDSKAAFKSDPRACKECREALGA